MFAILGEACNTEVILIGCLKIQCRHVVEDDIYPSADNCLGVFERNLLDLRLDVPTAFHSPFPMAQVVKETVYLVFTVDDAQVPPQVTDGLELASWIEQAGDDQVAEHVIPYPAVTDPVVKRSVNQLWTDDLELAVRQGCEEVHEAGVLGGCEQVKFFSMQASDIAACVLFKPCDLFLRMGSTETPVNTELAIALVDDMDADAS